MLYEFEGKKPIISRNVFIAPTACIIGDVFIGEGSSVWFNSVIRGDRARISIGKGSNIQDNTVMHSDDNEVEIGDGVIIGHGCIMHGRRIKNRALIGMNATILHGAEIGEGSIVGAGALLPPGFIVPDMSLVMGVPCKFARKTAEEDFELIEKTLENYAKLTEKYLSAKW
jgi:carbonic anhydrase/acetyltransferase-like protein (isoleucine patch superfamily)